MPAAHDHMRIAAIIPLYNGSAYIEAALRGVLAQSRPADEIIVVDDGSTDHGAAIVEALATTAPVTLLRQSNQGQSAARNYGVARSSSDLLAFLDQDDIWHPHHLRNLVQPFLTRNDDQLGWVYSNVDEIDEAGHLIARGILSDAVSVNPKRQLSTCLGQDMFVIPSASLVSRAAFEAIGGFDPALSGYEDDDLFLRMFSAGYHNIYLPESTVSWRIYRASASHSPRMARSRGTYARKLVKQYPDNPTSGRFFTRDALAPRFHPQFVGEFRRALRARRGPFETDMRSATEDLSFIRSCLPAFEDRRNSASDILISVVIVTLDSADLIDRTLRGVATQSVAPAEVIVVDRGSRDMTVARVMAVTDAHAVRVVRMTDQGLAAARDRGLSEAVGDVIAFIDPGDFWRADHLETTIQPFLDQRHRAIGVVLGPAEQLGARPSSATSLEREDRLAAAISSAPALSLSSCLFARNILRRLEGFDHSLMSDADRDVLIRLFQAGYGCVQITSPQPTAVIMPRMESSIRGQAVTAVANVLAALGRQDATTVAQIHAAFLSSRLTAALANARAMLRDGVASSDLAMIQVRG